MKLRYSLAFTLPLLSTSLIAADLAVKVEVPRLKVAEYHRPYMALWLEKPNQSFVSNLAVSYDVKKKDNGGAKWLNDMRQWWRKSGRDLKTPVDGITGATYAPGEHTLSLDGAKPALQKLPAGDYQFVIEAAREAGGREVVRIPFTWPPKAVETPIAKGKEELGNVTLLLKP